MDEKLEKAMAEVDEEDRYGIELDEARRMFDIFEGDEKFVNLIPEDEFYLENEATYRLWKMRKSSKPISYKDFYDVVEQLLAWIDHAETSGSYSNWDGHP